LAFVENYEEANSWQIVCLQSVVTNEQHCSSLPLVSTATRNSHPLLQLWQLSLLYAHFLLPHIGDYLFFTLGGGIVVDGV